MDQLLKAIDEALSTAAYLNREGQTTRSRALSLSITKLEEARHWAVDAAEAA